MVLTGVLPTYPSITFLLIFLISQLMQTQVSTRASIFLILFCSSRTLDFTQSQRLGIQLLFPSLNWKSSRPSEIASFNVTISMHIWGFQFFVHVYSNLPSLKAVSDRKCKSKSENDCFYSFYIIFKKDTIYLNSSSRASRFVFLFS